MSSGCLFRGVVFLLLAFGLLALPAFAAHTSSVLMTPAMSTCGALKTFTVNITNNGPDPVREVRLYNGTYAIDGTTQYPMIPPHANYTCGPAPSGWVLVDQHLIGFPYCQYQAVEFINPTNYIHAGESQAFTFSAVTTTESNYSWGVETYDTNLAWQSHQPRVTVDCSPPNTTKQYVGPLVQVGNVEWISNITLVQLQSTDLQPHPSGTNATYYRNTLVNDSFCGDPVKCNNATGTGPFLLYAGPFVKNEESCHLIEYFSTDRAGNSEPVKKQCPFVDTTPPVGNKTVGQPNIVSQDEDFDFLVTQDTNITIDCVDQGPHPVDQTTVVWRTGTNASGVVEFGIWQNSTEIEAPGEELVLQLDNDGFNILDFYCVDALGNAGPNEVEAFIVVTQVPVINKTVVGPQFGACPPLSPSDQCYIKANESVIVVSVTELMPDLNGITCNWSYTLDGSGPLPGGQNVVPPFNITFPEDSTHVLTIQCQDSLGGFVEENETFLVDSTPPVTSKTYGTPFYKDNATGREYITSSTPVTLNASDLKSGVKATFYMDTLLTGEDQLMCEFPQNCHPIHGYEGNWTRYAGPFNKVPDSCHLIEYWSKDYLLNKEQIRAQCVYVDNLPPLDNKTIGSPMVVSNLTVGGTCVNNTNQTNQSQPPAVEDPLGAVVHRVNFSQACLSGTGVGITFDGEQLWYSCYLSPTDLYRADPMTGNVTANYSILGGLGALAYDASRNAIWAAWGGSGADGNIYLIQLNATKGVVNSSLAFAANSGGMGIGDGLAFDASDDTLYVSPDVSLTIYHYTTNGTLLGSFPAAPSQCGNSGLALGGDLLYEGFDGCSEVMVVNKTNTSLVQFNFSTVLPGDPNFRDEDLDCDTNTFASIGKHVMWSIEAFEPRRATAFEIPFGSCGIGGRPPPPPPPPPPPVCVNETAEVFITNATPISISCTDQQPHPVDNTSLFFRYRLSNDCQAWGGWTAWMDPLSSEVTKTIYLPEDSCHQLEYYCADALGNSGPTRSEIDVVDTKAPITTLQVLGTMYFDVASDTTFIDGTTLIVLNCTDQQPHPVGVDKVQYRYQVIPGNNWTQWVEYEGPFSFPEPSQHILEYYCNDTLGNTEPVKNATFIVDMGRPTTVKRFQGPIFWSQSDLESVNGGSAVWTNETAFSGEFSARLALPAMTQAQDFAGVDAANLSLSLSSITGLSYMRKVTAFANGWSPVVILGIDVNNDSRFDAMPLEWEASLALGTPNPALLGNDSFVQCEATSGLMGTDADFVAVDAYDTFKCYTPKADGTDYTGDYRPLAYFKSNATGRVAPADNVMLLKVAIGGNLASFNNEVAYVDKVVLNNVTYIDDPAKWISSRTNITFSANSEGGAHSAGLNATYYRITLLGSDVPCLNDNVCQQQTGSGGFLAYVPNSSINIVQESCHLVEYYSITNVNRTENVTKQCVFVDNTPPIGNNTVGEPKAMWSGNDSAFYPWIKDRCWNGQADQIECWKVTVLTPVTLGCSDQGPHPVDHESLCYKVDLDGDDVTGAYCEGQVNADGWCCGNVAGNTTLYFREESEHDLQSYCTDALGNNGSIADEKFKVEGTAFELSLQKKWNLISVPFVLFNDSVSGVFGNAGNNITSVWSYDNGTWFVWAPNGPATLQNIRPGWGYWVIANNSQKILLAGSLFSPVATPPDRDLVKGWNLIGYYGTSWQEYGSDPFCQYDGGQVFTDFAYCSLNSLVDTQQGYPRWSSLWTYSNCASGNPWKGLNACTTNSTLNKMVAGQGYWIEMDVPDMYTPATVCHQQDSCVYFAPS